MGGRFGASRRARSFRRSACLSCTGGYAATNGISVATRSGDRGTISRGVLGSTRSSAITPFSPFNAFRYAVTTFRSPFSVKDPEGALTVGDWSRTRIGAPVKGRTSAGRPRITAFDTRLSTDFIAYCYKPTVHQARTGRHRDRTALSNARDI